MTQTPAADFASAVAHLRTTGTRPDALLATLLERVFAEALPCRCSPETCSTQAALAVAQQILGTTGASTPCGPVPDTCDAEAGDPCADHERQQAHEEGEHAFCGDECTTGEQPDVTQPEPAADRTKLRDRIARAIDATIDGTEGCANPRRLADAVLAVLPAPADRAATLREAAADAPCGRPASVSVPCSAGDHCCKGADEEQQAAPVETCRLVDIDGEVLRVRGAREMSDDARAALADVIRTVKRRAAAEQPDVPAVTGEPML